MRKKILSAACASFALLVSPTTVLPAQPSVVKALVDLTEAIEGIHGDEGAFIAPAVDRLAQALAGRDASGITSAVQDGLSSAPLLPLARYREAYARLAGGDVE